MRLFFSAGEPSGDLHGSNLIRAIQSIQPSLQAIGFGGDRMAEASVQILEPMAHLSFMWLRAYRHYYRFKRLVDQASSIFQRKQVDGVVVIDYPGFNWHIARRAHECGIPVFYFVPPQLWAWGGWRIRKMRRYVDHVLCTMPFEFEWYSRRGMRTHYIGHPYFDAIHTHVVDHSFLNAQNKLPGRVVALLPGSRHVEVEYNLQPMLRAAKLIHQTHPDTRFLMAAVNREFKQLLEQQCSSTKLPLEIHMDRTHEILRLATVCIAVSGSVGLELLYHGVPSAISYHVHPVGWLSTVALKKVRWISLVNLLANRTVLPEFMSFRCQSGQIAAQLNDWLSSPKKAAAVREQLFSMAQEHAVPGACIRAAEYIVRNMPGHIHHLAHQRVSVERYRHFIQPTRDVTHADSALESGSTSLAKEPA